MAYWIGIDTVEIKRLAHWHTYSHAQLARIFSPQEIAYCLSHKAQSAPRFAVRFAAREAFLKAVSTAFNISYPLLTISKQVQVTKRENGAVDLLVNWSALITTAVTPAVSLSLTHTNEIATAIVLLSNFTHVAEHHAVIGKI